MKALNKSPHFSILAVVLTDVAATELEITYISYLKETGETSCKFLQISDVPNATVEGLHQKMSEVLQEIDAKVCIQKWLKIAVLSQAST